MSEIEREAQRVKVANAMIEFARANGMSFNWNPEEWCDLAEIALRSASTPPGPVAWRVKDYADRWVYYHTEEGARHAAWATSDAIVQPLYLTTGGLPHDIQVQIWADEIIDQLEDVIRDGLTYDEVVGVHRCVENELRDIFATLAPPAALPFPPRTTSPSGSGKV